MLAARGRDPATVEFGCCRLRREVHCLADGGRAGSARVRLSLASLESRYRIAPNSKLPSTIFGELKSGIRFEPLIAWMYGGTPIPAGIPIQVRFPDGQLDAFDSCLLIVFGRPAIHSSARRRAAWCQWSLTCPKKFNQPRARNGSP
jgi:hypothetical protein